MTTTRTVMLLSSLLLVACDNGTLTHDRDGSTSRADAGPVEAADFCAALSALVCASNDLCCGGLVGGGEDADCESQQLEACRETVEELLDDPRTGYDPARGGAYLEALRVSAQGCFAAPPRLTDFLAVFRGTGIAGADCTPASVSDDRSLRVSQLSCADGLACHLYRRSDGNTVGVCEPRDDTGCSHRFDCGAGEWCNLPDGWEPGRWGTCQPLKANGWNCTSDLECASHHCDTERTCADPFEERYCAARSYEGVVLEQRPLGYWRLGDVGGAAADDRGEANIDGLYVGGPRSAEGALEDDEDGALALDGVDDGVIIAGLDARRSGNAISFECWFRRTEASSTGPLLEFADEEAGLGARLWSHNASDRVHANFFDEAGENHGITSEEGVIEPDTWYHVVATYDGAVGRLYVNGERVGEETMGAFRPRTTGALYVGLREEDERRVTGAIDEVAFYDHALTPAQIKQHRARGVEGPAPQEFVLFRWLR